MSHFIYLRSLRYVEHTVFSVADGQKFYRDPLFGGKMAYSSGQQVKRSILDSMTSQLNVPFAPVTFNWTINKEDNAQQGEAWSVCDPSFPDQLIGGYMRAEKDTSTIKRRSPLSISAMRPLHPLLGGIEKEDENQDGQRRPRNGEAMSFDRSASADRQTVNVYREVDGKRVKMTDEQVAQWLEEKSRGSLAPKKWLDPQQRASGLFVYDIAVDLRTLFCVSMNQLEPELYPETIEKLKAAGWIESENVFGRCLVCPKEQREKIIPALADALINWRITSNQARTFSVMETLALAVSNNANHIAYAIRAELDEEVERKANPVIDETAKAEIFLTPSISGYIKGEKGNASALDDACEYLKSQLLPFNYESQLK